MEDAAIVATPGREVRAAVQRGKLNVVEKQEERIGNLIEEEKSR